MAIRCTDPECSRTTTGGKPYCKDHVGKMPQIESLSQRLAKIEELEKEAESDRQKKK